jgi:hypothetical protein
MLNVPDDTQRLDWLIRQGAPATTERTVRPGLNKVAWAMAFNFAGDDDDSLPESIRAAIDVVMAQEELESGPSAKWNVLWPANGGTA